jgi:hypothetical protein
MKKTLNVRINSTGEWLLSLQPKLGGSALIVLHTLDTLAGGFAGASERVIARAGLTGSSTSFECTSVDSGGGFPMNREFTVAVEPDGREKVSCEENGVDGTAGSRVARHDDGPDSGLSIIMSTLLSGILSAR